MIPDPTSRLFARLRKPELRLGLHLGLTSGGPRPISFDFTGGSLPGGITLTRASTAYYVNVSGVITSAANDVARFDYSLSSIGTLLGFLVEPQATNLVLRSTWAGGVSGSPGTAPTGWTQTDVGNSAITYATDSEISGGNTMRVLTAGGTQRFYQAQTISVSTSTLYFGSVIADITTSAQIQQLVQWVSLPAGASISYYVDRVVVSSTTVPSVGRRELACLLTVAGTAGSPALRIGIGIAGATNGDVTYRRPQIEVGSSRTSYVPTTSAQVTRSADAASFTITPNVSQIRYTFDDNSTQTVSVSSGTYSIPTNLNRARIKGIVSL